jgi:hypothetical protein
MLTHCQKISILKRFPTDFKLCNGRVVHNKIYLKTDYYRIIPKGKKYFVWFTKNNNAVTAYFLEKGRYKTQIVDILTYDVCFDSSLTIGKGTICYGTLFKCGQINYFSIEDILYFKSTNIHAFSWKKKLSILAVIMSLTKQVCYTNSTVVLGVPIITTDKSDILKEMQNIPYTPYSLEYINSKKNKIIIQVASSIQHDIKPCIFKIKATIKSDIYNIFCEGYNIGIASVPNYKTSVMLNKLYRNIKENHNLDMLEESDDEDDFEDINEDKYVDLEKEYTFECVYNKKFKMWTPIKQLPDNSNITQYSKIQYLVKKYS